MGGEGGGFILVDLIVGKPAGCTSDLFQYNIGKIGWAESTRNLVDSAFYSDADSLTDQRNMLGIKTTKTDTTSTCQC